MQRLGKFFLLSYMLIICACDQVKTNDLRSESAISHKIIQLVKPLIDTGETIELLKQKYGGQAESFIQDFKENTTLQPKTMNAIGQVAFLRKSGQERKDIRLQPRFKDYAGELFSLFQKLGDVDPVYPSRKTYDYVLINGSTVKNMRERLYGLSWFVKNNMLTITPQTKIVFLTGDRDLFKPEDEGALEDCAPFNQNPNWQEPKTKPKSEYEAAQWIWQQSDLPETLRLASIIFINAPKTEAKNTQTGQITWNRPTTSGTVKAWLEQDKPKPGTCLAISSQPFVYYQLLTIQKNLPPEFRVEGAGLSIHTKESFVQDVDIFLDNFARTIYTELSS